MDWKQGPGLSASQTGLPVSGGTLLGLRPEAHQSRPSGGSCSLLETRKKDSEREEIDKKRKTQKASRERL